MPERLAKELAAFQAEVGKASTEAELYQLQVAYLGKKGSITQLRSLMGTLAPENRKYFGQEFNRVKQAVMDGLAAQKLALQEQQQKRDLERFEDLTMPPVGPPLGTLHPISHTRRRLIRIFHQLGFEVAEGPHIEHVAYNFDALNFLPNHPARDTQDTFFVQSPIASDAKETTDIVLRTHTSPVQIRTMLKRQPPIRIIAPGTVFRRDDDPTHSPMFHQLEGLYVDRNVSLAHLKSTLLAFTEQFFATKSQIRLRPSYFPFVEPGVEFDMQCPFCQGPGCSVCKKTGWIELGGAGMVHPAVFEAVGIDPEHYSGWAFGFGIDRMAMLRYGIPDVRRLFEGDLRFLEQFPC